MGISTDISPETSAFQPSHGPRRQAPAPRLSERVVVPIAAAVTAGLLAREP